MQQTQASVQALVSSVSGRRAVVRADAAVCARCVAGKGCGAGLFGTGAREITADIANGVSVRAGDTVVLCLDTASISRGAWFAYGLPLAGLLLGSIAAFLSGASDGIAAGAGLAGLAAGVLIGRWFASRGDCISRLRPTISGLSA